MKSINLFILLLLITFSLSAQQPKLFEKSEKEPFTIVEQMPEYPGGEEALMKFLQKNIKYPNSALENDIQGTVLVNFVLCEDGSICQLKVIKSPDTSLSRAAAEVISKMPNWKPGKQKGENVRVYFDVPINFTLEGDDDPIVLKDGYYEKELSKKELKNLAFLSQKVIEFKYNYKDLISVKVSSKSEFNTFNSLVKAAQKSEVFTLYDIYQDFSKLNSPRYFHTTKYKITIE